ncbi:AI-2E family transporter [Chloroflexota bacterium]
MNTIQQIFIRHRRLVIFIVSTTIVFWLFYTLRSVILPFVIGLLFAYLLLPVISWFEKKLPRRGKWLQAKRISVIILSYIVILGGFAALSFYISLAVIDALIILVNNAPQYISSALLRIKEGTEVFRQYFPPEMQYQVDQFILDVGEAAGNAARNVLRKGISLVPATIGFAFGLASLPIFLFYILKDWEKLSDGFYSSLPPWAIEHTRNIISIIDRVLGRYIRAQLMLGFIVGYLSFVSLLLLGVPFAPTLGILAGVTELIPILGPWISGVTAVIVTLAVLPEKAIWVAIIFLGVQLLENSLLVPRIQGAYLRMHPAVVIVLLVLGAYMAGFWGIIVIIPLTATIVEIYKYTQHLAPAEETQ